MRDINIMDDNESVLINFSDGYMDICLFLILFIGIIWYMVVIVIE